QPSQSVVDRPEAEDSPGAFPPREGYHYETLLMGTAPPLGRPEVEELQGRYRIVAGDEAARAANVLAQAREMTVLGGDLDAFALRFSSLNATYRRMENGISTAPGMLGKI